MRGCYRSKYHGAVNGEERYMIVTQFESRLMRSRAMPCWDEPAYKASFTLHLTTAANLTAVSNMPIKETKPATSAASTPSTSASATATTAATDGSTRHSHV